MDTYFIMSPMSLWIFRLMPLIVIVILVLGWWLMKQKLMKQINEQIDAKVAELTRRIEELDNDS